MVDTVEKNIPAMTRLAITPRFAGKTKKGDYSFVGRTFVVRAIDKKSGREVEFATSPSFWFDKDRTAAPLVNRGVVLSSDSTGDDFFVFPCVPLRRELSKELYDKAWETMPYLTPAEGFLPITALFQFRINEDGTDIVAEVNEKLAKAVSYFVVLYAGGYSDHRGSTIVDKDARAELEAFKTREPIRVFTPNMLSIMDAQDAKSIIGKAKKGTGKVFATEDDFPKLKAVSDEAKKDFGIKDYSIRQEHTCLPYGFFEMGSTGGMVKKRAELAKGEFDVFTIGSGTVKIHQIQGTESAIGIWVEAHFKPISGETFELGFTSNVCQVGCDGYSLSDFYNEGPTDLGIIGRTLYEAEVKGNNTFGGNALLIDATRSLYCNGMDAIKEHPEIFDAFIAETVELLDENVFRSLYQDETNTFLYSLRSDIIIAYLGMTKANTDFSNDTEMEICTKLCENDRDWLRVFKNCGFTIIDSDINGSNLEENNFVAAASLLTHFSPSLSTKVAADYLDEAEQKRAGMNGLRTVQSRASICVEVSKGSDKIIDGNVDTVFIDYLVRVFHKGTGGELLFETANNHYKDTTSYIVNREPQIPLKDGSTVSVDEFFTARVSSTRGLVVRGRPSIVNKSDYVVELIPTRAGVYTPTAPDEAEQQDRPIADILALLHDTDYKWIEPYMDVFCSDDTATDPAVELANAIGRPIHSSQRSEWAIEDTQEE